MRDGGGGLRQAHPEPLAGEGVDIPGRSADQPHPAGGAPRRALPQRAGAAQRARGLGAPQPVGELGKGRQGAGVVGVGRPEDGDPDDVVGHGRDVGLDAPTPVHLDEIGPRCDVEVLTQPEPPPVVGAVPTPGKPVHRSVEPDDATHGRVQPVAPEQPARANPGGRDRVPVLLDRPDAADDAAHPERGRPRVQGRVQRGAAHAEARPGLEVVLDVPGAAAVADPEQRVALRVHPEPRERRHRSRHEPFAARLVDRRPARLDDDDVQPGEPCLYRGGKPDRPPAHDEHVGVETHVVVEALSGAHRAPARARSSAGIRNLRSSTALSSVNTSAVSHAVCTSGSATPSTTTAT